MSKPVIGVTVGTPTSPAKIADEIKPVKTVNWVAPDKNGNVEVEGGGIDISTARVGQTIVVKAVDENGKPTEWESADFPESGANIITAESKDELPDPASVPEGTIAFVKSEEKVFDLTAMGFPVVEGAAGNYNLTTDTTEIKKAFSSGKIAFSFDFLFAGNKVFVTTGATMIPATNAVMGSTIVVVEGAFVIAAIIVDDEAITIKLDVL